MTQSTKSYDYVIVGGGSAGCVLARRLTDAGSTVLLLEAGPRDWSPYLHVPAGLMKAAPYITSITDEPDPSRSDQTMSWNGGRVLGGGSSINGMVWTRGHRADFDAWADAGCAGWSYDDVLPYFKRSEDYENGADKYRGAGGPVRVGMPRVGHPLTDAFIAAAQGAGHEYSDDSNGERLGGISYCQANQWRGFRHSMARAYLGVPARRPGLDIVTRAQVRRVLFEGGRATGVEYTRKGRLQQARCNKEVIISAGVMGSPKLLMLSGIGPADHLQSLHLPVVVDNDRVGQNLQEHIVLMMVWNVDMPTFNMAMTLGGFVRHGLEFLLHGSGPAAMSVGHAIIYTGLDPDSGQPKSKALFTPLGLVGADAGDTSKETLESAGEHDVTRMELLSRPSVSAWVSTVHPHARGTVRLRSADPNAPVEIRMQLLGDDRDLAALVDGCRTLRRVFSESPMAEHVLGEALPGPMVESDKDWERYARTSSHGGQHAVGTCSMGPGAGSVVDPELRVRGVEGLRVVDASIFPLLTSSHTNAPTVMVAERAAAFITES